MRKSTGYEVACESIAAFPNYIPYFNEIAGGATHSIEWLDDSNVDWGEGIRDAVDYIKAHHLENAEIFPFSPLDNPRYYGFTGRQRSPTEMFQLLTSQSHPGTYIISANNLVALRRMDPQWKAYKPVDRIDDALWVYRF